MGQKLAIDLGTTNSVIARWDIDHEQAEVLAVPGISDQTEDDRPPLVPSLLYVQDGKSGTVTLGQAVRDSDLDSQRDNRLFRNFKRGIVASPAPDPRPIDDQLWGRPRRRSQLCAWPHRRTALHQRRH